MSCAACSAAVEKAVSRLDGVAKAEVNLMGKSMLCEYDEARLKRDDIIAAVAKAGFSASLFGSNPPAQAEAAGRREVPVKTRLAVSAAFLAPLMYISMGHMLHLPQPPFLHGVENSFWFALVQLALALPVVFVNRKFYVNGFKALFHRAPNMDSLIAVGSVAALGYGAASVIIIGYALANKNMQLAAAYSSNLYFESAAMILALVTLGKYLEARSVSRTGSAISSLMQLAPENATVIRNGAESVIPVSEITPGDTVIIKPGERIPVDGFVISGLSYVDESALTGESVAVQKSEGNEVFSACVNQNGTFTMRADKVGADTVLARIIELVENTGASKAPVARLADKIAGVFVPVVMAISAVTALVWLISGSGAEFALRCAISVLVVSCPCALGLATPVAITAATGKCASNGILIKSAEAIETLGKISTAVFDKTGTITSGEPRITDVIPFAFSEAELLPLAAAMEKASEHPLAKAVSEYAGGLQLPEVEAFETVPGKGITAEIRGKKYFAGNDAYMHELAVDISQSNEAAARLYSEGKTVMYFAAEGALLGVLAARDEIKETSAKAIEIFKKLGVKTVMLTGDNEATAKAIAGSAGTDTVIAGVLPQGKAEYIASLTASGETVAMVGDGINDSPALVAADVGIAIGSGTDIAIDSADIVLMGSDLRDAARATAFSRRVMRNIKQNLFWAFFYNTICIPLAAGAFYPLWGLTLSPMIAAAAMSFSSIFVVTNALRLYKSHGEDEI